jgi:hypothetical protein
MRSLRVIGFLNAPHLSNPNMALGLTQPPAESTEYQYHESSQW